MIHRASRLAYGAVGKMKSKFALQAVVRSVSAASRLVPVPPPPCKHRILHLLVGVHETLPDGIGDGIIGVGASIIGALLGIGAGPDPAIHMQHG
jgi:hypothetical protein